MTLDFDIRKGNPSAEHSHHDAALAEAVSEVSNPLAVLDRIVAQVLVLVSDADGATVELADAEELIYVCCGGNLAAHVGTRLRMGSSFSGLSVTTNQVLRCDDSETDPRVDLEACRRVGAVSMVCVPLRGPGGAIGVLKVAARRPRAFDDRDVVVLERLAPFITTTVSAASDLSKVISQILNFSDTEALSPCAFPPCGEVLNSAEAAALTQFVADVMRPGMVDEVDAREAILATLRPGALSTVVQPIYELGSGKLFGIEALARFQGPPIRPPDQWFAEAHRVGLGVELELEAVRNALAIVSQVPSGVHVAINVGPTAAADPRLSGLLEAVQSSCVVLELTEHVEIDDYPSLRKALNRYRGRGIKLAADDTGAGVSGLTHILRLAPDYIKLDRELTQGIELDSVRRSLASALVAFSSESGAQVVAEGIENADALRVLTDLGVTYGQGYHLGRPGPIEDHLLCFQSA